MTLNGHLSWNIPPLEVLSSPCVKHLSNNSLHFISPEFFWNMMSLFRSVRRYQWSSLPACSHGCSTPVFTCILFVNPRCPNATGSGTGKSSVGGIKQDKTPTDFLSYRSHFNWGYPVCGIVIRQTSFLILHISFISEGDSGWLYDLVR